MITVFGREIPKHLLKGVEIEKNACYEEPLRIDITAFKQKTGERLIMQFNPIHLEELEEVISFLRSMDAV